MPISWAASCACNSLSAELLIMIFVCSNAVLHSLMSAYLLVSHIPDLACMIIRPCSGQPCLARSKLKEQVADWLNRSEDVP